MVPLLRLFYVSHTLTAQFCYKSASLASVLMFFVLLVPVATSAAEDYSIPGIVVNGDGKDLEEAKKLALAQGEKDAFSVIIARLLPSRLAAITQKTPANQISSFIASVETSQEETTQTHYHAVIKYSFNPDAIQKFLHEFSAAETKQNQALSNQPNQQEVVIPPSAVNGQPRRSVLVLPVFNDGNNLSLWQDDNNWRQVWYEAALESGNGLVVAPLGDFDDRVDVDSTNILEASVSSLSRMYDRYGVGEIAIANSFYNLKADPKPTLEVTITRLAPGIKDVSHMNFTIRSTETLDTLMVRAAHEIAKSIYKQQTIDKIKLESERVKELSATFTSSTITDWQLLRKHLLERKNIVNIRFTSISFYETSVIISYRGTFDVLGKSLVASGLRVMQDGEKLILALP